MNHRRISGIALAGAVSIAWLATGCSQYRGMPSHGGGKRFDEEQRAVAASIRRTISSMDIAELQGRKTALVVSNLYTSGSGTTTWSGLQDIGLGLGYSAGDTILKRTVPPGTSYRDDTFSDRDSANLSLRYRPYNSYRAANHGTEGDLRYFRAALEMKARHNGLSVVTRNPEVLLHVLVDVLGTNHSRRDIVFYAREELKACCEVTYYAQDVKSGKLIFKSRQTGSAASYREGHVFMVPASSVKRSVRYSKPVYFDTAEARPRNGCPAEIPDDLMEVKRACQQMDPEQRERMLEALYDRARYYIENGRPEQAGDDVQTIREIDPGYKGLGDLQEDLEKLNAN